jgi:hypothetical protein
MGQTINLQVTMTQYSVPTNPATLTILGQGGPGLGTCTWTGQWPLTPTFTFNCTMSTSTAAAYNGINWSYTSGGASGFIGQTAIPIYVTLAPPLQYTASGYAPIVYHTTLNLALSGGQATDQTTAFQNTWNQFSVPAPTTSNPNATGPENITTWQGRRLYYYRNGPNGGTIVGFNGCALDEGTLLLNVGLSEDASGNLYVSGPGHNSGQCGSFAYLLVGALAVNGIQSAVAQVAPSSSIETSPAFLVNNWSAPSSNQTGPWTLCLNNGDFMVPAQPGGVYCNLTSLPTLPGQNTQPPSEKVFNVHFIVKPAVAPSLNLGYLTLPNYVDPSYGVTYAGPADFQNKAVFGYFDSRHPIGSFANPNNPNQPLLEYSVSPAVGSTTNITISP